MLFIAYYFTVLKIFIRPMALYLPKIVVIRADKTAKTFSLTSFTGGHPLQGVCYSLVCGFSMVGCCMKLAVVLNSSLLKFNFNVVSLM